MLGNCSTTGALNLAGAIAPPRPTAFPAGAAPFEHRGGERADGVYRLYGRGVTGLVEPDRTRFDERRGGQQLSLE